MTNCFRIFIKRIVPLLLCLLCFLNIVTAQDYLGINTSNYAGVTGVALQPASIVDSRYKFDINLFSTSNNFSNNYLRVHRKAILKFNANNFEDYKTFKSKYLSETQLDANDRVWFDVNSRIQMPLSFMATLNAKSAIALTFENRFMMQARNISPDLAKMSYNTFYYPPLNNQPIDASGFSLNTLNWIEIGLTYGHVLYSSGRHFLKGAFTAKYLGGVASLYLASNNLALQVNNDSSINFNTNRFDYNRNDKADFNIFERNLTPDASSFGFSAGLVYEYRSEKDLLKFVKQKDGKYYDVERRDLNKYLFKVGVSLLDAGRFDFTKAQSVNNFSGNVNNWHLNNANYENFYQFDTALNNRTTAFAGDSRHYTVHMPMALSVQADIRLAKGLYVNAMAYRPIKTGDNDAIRFDNYGYYAVTPRYEGRFLGIYIPYSYNDRKNGFNYQKHQLGASIRLGPLFIGSSNLGTMIFNKNLKAADIYAGLKVGITYGKPTKTQKLIDKIIKKDDSNIERARTTTIEKDTVMVIEKKRSNQPQQVLVDYANGKVYANPNSTGNVVIINNNTYYLNSNKDSVIRKEVLINPADTVVKKTDTGSTKMPAANMPATINKQLRDSLTRKQLQLDSTIKRLERIRTELDSSIKANSIIDSSGKSASNNQIKQGKQIAKASRDSSTVANARNADTVAARNASEVRLMKPDTSANTTATNTVTTNAVNNSTEKKNLTADRDSIIVYRAAPGSATQTTASISANALKEYEARNSDRQEQILRRQAENYDREMENTKRLEAEINDLRNQMYRQETPRNYAEQNYAYNNGQPPVGNRIDTVYLRDSIYVKDTLIIRDTLVNNIIQKDTLIRTINAAPKTVFVPVKKDTVIVQKQDYSLLPEEVILFGLGDATVRQVYYNRLDYLASLLQKDAALRAVLTGHTDKTGSPKINAALSEKRAAAVKNYLKSKGIDESKLIIQSLAASEPAVDGNSKAALSQNRRVTVKLTYENQ